MPDYYEILGVDRSATQDEVKRAYKRLALKHHPDRNPGSSEAERRFKQVSEAYHVLGDAGRRSRYDRYGEVADEGSGFQEVDIATVAEFFESIFGDLFGRRRRREADIHHDLKITFEEAAFGAEKPVRVARPVACPGCGGSGAPPGTERRTCSACNGAGEVRYQQGPFVLNRPCRACTGRGQVFDTPCASCKGTGKGVREEEVRIELPPGVDDGAERILRGQGAEGEGGAGDLHVHVRVEPHPFFTRRKSDVLCSVPITFPQAALGDEIEVPTIDGKVLMKVKAGTQAGQTYKLRGKGIPGRGGRRGDQMVRIEVEVPRELTPRQAELVRELGRELGTDVHPQQRTFLDRLKDLFQ